ncbi:hypothetical protein AtubIFM55763_002979 [Aspergillus tubingensis]|uniref:Similar to An11g06880 n=1 Tax=Aspergillus niger TaxID=5061 RepID=A0A117E0F1_ASPNG|nr:similar to An11g06880 [Aspergillus tubingensis]GAQ42470.1 similar to An11g06880 [Aspergillus niger]GFN17128.1 similar to An11g06880 [Aspergillus tubingensis]GLA57854.1 hypothetical protein AtubIFM54640_005649 [Aspergillus tubingensis]GLA72440.1 hypothetical protein AtubIFM55763_002979 [Aspergillus tubingensis]GLA91758.1 hypothetical protein AtubIFM57143_005270 [Aspergillus tubingensis]
MFDLPSAKRVRREELLSRTSTSPSPSPPPESSLTDVHQRLGALLNIDSLLAPQSDDPTPQPTTNADEEEEEQEFEFRLFSAPAKSSSKNEEPAAVVESSSTTQAQKLRIRVRSPTPGAVGVEDGRFVNPFRGWGYYFSAPGMMAGEKEKVQEEEERLREKRRQFEDVAVSGVQVVGFSGVSWPGCHLPWRVVTLKSEKKSKGAAVTCAKDPAERAPTSLKKPGKKRRIQLRKRVSAAEERKKKEEEKKLLEAEKRNRKNREKKIKRRQKAREEKAAKAAAAGAAGEAPAGQMDVDVSSDEGSD